MKENLKVLLKKFLLVLFVTVVFDQTIGHALNYFYFKHQPISDISTTTYVADHCRQQALVLGSSRACHHYISNDIKAGIDLTCYNAGADGEYILYSYAMLKCVLMRYTPKVVILDLLPDEFKISQQNYDRLSVLLPYYQNHPEIRSIIELKSPYERAKLLSEIYPFNSLILPIVSLNIHENNQEFKPDDQNGFLPLTDTINIDGNRFIDSVYDNYRIDPELVKAYRSVIQDCRSHRIKLYVFVSPLLYSSRFTTKSIKIASQIALDNKIPFFDFTNDKIFKGKIYFTDFGHLNNNGAKLYTAEVLAEIKATHY